jgi:hypothetical protein
LRYIIEGLKGKIVNGVGWNNLEVEATLQMEIDYFSKCFTTVNSSPTPNGAFDRLINQAAYGVFRLNIYDKKKK